MAWTTNVVVVANRTAQAPELIAALQARAERGATRFTLVVPAEGADRSAAQGVLAEALSAYQAAGLDAEGQVGDPDPVVAASEIWDPRRHDEVIVSTLPTGVSKWLLVDMPHRIEKATGQAVTHVVATPERSAPSTEPAPKRENPGVLGAITGLGRGPRESGGTYSA